MEIEKYNPNSLSVCAILGLIESRDIAIPEIQRPFVWKRPQVWDAVIHVTKTCITDIHETRTKCQLGRAPE